MTERPRRDIFDRLLALPVLRLLAPFYYRHREGLLYLFFGVLTTAISWVSFYLFYYVCAIGELTANALSWVAAVLVAFLTNRAWVFATEGGRFLSEMGKFFASRVLTLLVEELIIFLFVSCLAFPAMIVKIGGNVLILLLNYLLSKFFVFAKK